MNKDVIVFSSKIVEISEHKNYLELTNRLCYYDDKNLNNVLLPYKDVEELALEYANTLVNMPVQAKYKRIKNLDDLGGHEAFQVGSELVFNTDSIGTHTEVYIENSEVTTVNGETKELPCLYAKCRIWKRHKNIIAAIKRLFNTKEGLNTSWEIEVSEYEFANGVKKLINYEFIGNTFLGSTTTPAYKGTSKTISLSSVSNQELMIAEALATDIVSDNDDMDLEITTKNEEETMSKTNKVDLQNTETSTANEVELKSIDGDNVDNELEISALTDKDIRKKLTIACREKFGDCCWLTKVFPEEKVCWCDYDCEKETDYLSFSYEINDEDITVSEPTKLSFAVSLKEVNSAIAQRDESLLKANEKIQELESEISELKPFKEKLEEIIAQKAEEEKKEKQKELLAYALKSNFITNEEIDSENSEIAQMISELNKDGIDKIIVDRLMSSLETKEKVIETSSVEESKKSINLYNDDSASMSAVALFLND